MGSDMGPGSRLGSTVLLIVDICLFMFDSLAPRGSIRSPQ